MGEGGAEGEELGMLVRSVCVSGQAWQSIQAAAMEAKFAEKEGAMRAALRRERDEEIERAIARLEEDAANTNADTERSTLSRIQ